MTKSVLSAGRPSAKADKRKEATLASLADRPAKKRVNIDLTYEEHQRLKIYAAQNGMTIKDILREQIDKLIDGDQA
ncbi:MULTISPECIES: plasmid partition protein ParG [Halomonadaceae]|uniref:Antitoxin ParD n=1 Tax=Halomonas casei TaxID=2742613 RepID=A0ABR9F4F4_9GAMM|nr:MULTISPECIES: plasmid partition protein ParG [Halomonas]MBE0401356.1 chromosome partitioning protein ParB [Halomonas casei]WKD30475.1 chromosome partitioning protein ParB [Halomonas sp. KG2]